MSRLELRIPPLLLAAIFGAAMWLAARTLPAAGFELPARLPLAIALAAVGAGFTIAGVVAFRRARTTVSPITPGAASTVVTGGVYRISRNPMYVGFLLLLAGWGVHLANVVALLLLPAFVAWMNRFQIEPEERALSAKFGAGFDRYRQSVRRWL